MSPDQSSFDKIKCPNCGELIAISETIYHQIAEKTRDELKLESVKQQKVLAEKEGELKKKEAALDATIQERLKAERAQIEKQALKRAGESLLVEMEDLKHQAAEKENRLEQAQKIELELRKQKRALEDREKQRDLEIARTLDDERRKIQDETIKRIEEQHRLKDAEKEKKLQDAIKANEELSRKLQQGSQQTQGEVLELDIEQSVRIAFPTDQVEPVPKGIGGADILQRVFNNNGHACGSIIWETKRTKAWSDGWLQKLKDDQRRVKADIAILVSEALPKDCINFKQVKGVWVSNPQCAINLAAALRLVMTEVAQTKLAAVGKNEKMEVLYHYLSGAEFRQRIEAIVESFVDMQKDLQEERRTAERRWAKREKQIQRVISNTSGMYGDLQGLIGSSLHNIPALTSGEGSDQDQAQGETD
jgi:hypothetical protein